MAFLSGCCRAMLVKAKSAAIEWNVSHQPTFARSFIFTSFHFCTLLPSKCPLFNDRFFFFLLQSQCFSVWLFHFISVWSFHLDFLSARLNSLVNRFHAVRQTPSHSMVVMWYWQRSARISMGSILFDVAHVIFIRCNGFHNVVGFDACFIEEQKTMWTEQSYLCGSNTNGTNWTLTHMDTKREQEKKRKR